MMQSEATRNIILIVIVVAAIVFAYFFFVKKDDTKRVTTAPTTQEQRDPESEKALSLLNELQSIDIDTEFFSSAGFKSLKDFGRKMPPQEKGRSNPFAPLGE